MGFRCAKPMDPWFPFAQGTVGFTQALELDQVTVQAFLRTLIKKGGFSW